MIKKETTNHYNFLDFCEFYKLDSKEKKSMDIYNKDKEKKLFFEKCESIYNYFLKKEHIINIEISNNELKKYFNMKERKLRKVISEIAKNKKYKRIIMSNYKGYYLVQKDKKEEARKEIQVMKKRAIETLVRCMHQEKKLKKDGQFVMDPENFNKIIEINTFENEKNTRSE